MAFCFALSYLTPTRLQLKSVTLDRLEVSSRLTEPLASLPADGVCPPNLTRPRQGDYDDRWVVRESLTLADTSLRLT